MGNGLAQRVNNAPAQGNGAGQNRPATLTDQIRSMESQFELAMPKGAEAQQLVRDAITVIRQTPKLAECEPATVFGALMTCAQLGLRPGVLGHAYLLPLWNGRARQFEAQLIIGYQGMVELVHRSGKIKSMTMEIVYDGDHYVARKGLNPDLEHVPAPPSKRGEPIAYYATYQTKDGGQGFEAMWREEIEEHRDKYAMAKKRDGTVVGPWRDNFDAMALKTCVRQMFKLMPKSTDLLTAAMVSDESVRVDLHPDAIYRPQHPSSQGQVEQKPNDDSEQPEQQQGQEATPLDSSQAVEMVTDAHINAITRAFEATGVTDEAAQREQIVSLIARDITSISDLTVDEAQVVHEVLTSENGDNQ